MVHYMALGDSYTCGTSVPSEDSFPHQLRTQLMKRNFPEPQLSICAHEGWTAQDLLLAPEFPSIGTRADLVTLNVGVNEHYRGFVRGDMKPALYYIDELDYLIECAVAFTGDRPDRVIILSIPDWGATRFAKEKGYDGQIIARGIEAFNERIRYTAREGYEIRFVDVTVVSRQRTDDPHFWASDGLHPSGRLYAEWVNLILPEALQALGELKKQRRRLK